MHFILLEDNLGFAKGNNVGFQFAKHQLNANIIILSNNDIIYYQEDFIELLIKNYEEVGFEGEEWRVQKLEEKITKLNVSSQVRRIDYYANTAELYNMFDIYLLPSTNPDPLPTVVLEAMACGKPIVGYRHGGVCEMVKEGENGLLVEVNQPEALSKAVEAIVVSKDLRTSFGKKSVERQKNLFSLDSYIDNFSNLYFNLIREKQRRI